MPRYERPPTASRPLLQGISRIGGLRGLRLRPEQWSSPESLPPRQLHPQSDSKLVARTRRDPRLGGKQKSPTRSASEEVTNDHDRGRGIPGSFLSRHPQSDDSSWNGAA